MMRISKILIAGMLSLFASAANSATVLIPTDGDVNFVVNKPFVETKGYSLAIFDDDATISAGKITDPGLNVILTGPFLSLSGETYQGLINFSGATAYQASNTDGDILNFTPGTDEQFIVGLGVTDGLGAVTWYADSGSSFGVNTALLEFNIEGQSQAFLVDVQPIPVPAAVWLFGSGLIGLVGVARRRA